MNVRFVLIISIGLILAHTSFGALEKASVSAKEQTSSNEVKKKKIGVDQSDFMPDAKSFGFIVSYGASYDQLEPVDEKTTKHRINFAGTYSFDKSWSAYGVIGAAHESYSNNIVRDNDNDQFHVISNLNLGIVHSVINPTRFLPRSSNTFNIALPVSEESRVDKHIMSLSLSNFMQSHSWKKFSVFNRLVGNFLWNSQKFSLFNGDELNNDWLISNSFGLTYMILPNLGARFNFKADMIRYLDGSWELSFGDNLSVFTNLSGFQLFASMINNSYPENERIDLGYHDKYRRAFLGGVTYAF